MMVDFAHRDDYSIFDKVVIHHYKSTTVQLLVTH